MLKIRRILFVCLSVVFSSSYCQNTLHLCEGVGLENFRVPYLQGSIYQWQINGPPGIANIVGGNGTSQILVDIQSAGNFVLSVEETDSNGCKAADSMQVIIHPLPQVDFITIPIDSCSPCDKMFIPNINNVTDSVIFIVPLEAVVGLLSILNVNVVFLALATSKLPL